MVKNGVAELGGIITDGRQRSAAVVAARNVAGVNAVHDRLCRVDTMSGVTIDPQDEELAKAS